ncbi:MAG TPA: hypothetical protein VMT43_06185 [Acidimicrobiales bacterium]|nr:hypothetical protein [Acidimicrobiales bacterium]
MTMVAADPLYTTPFVDVDEWRDEPVRHRYVHGGFEGTELLFSLYFPPHDRYEGRFFQPIMFMSGTEHAAGSGLLDGMGASIGFAVDSGAYLVESNLGRRSAFPGDDPTITGYRASAATARYSRELAAEMYGEHRPFGYCWGGSGGGFKTMSCLESTTGVWDGGVPFVIGSPLSLPNVFGVAGHAMRLLGHKAAAIADAVEPGGSGDMYAGLTAEERDALAEVTRMGFPPRAWSFAATVDRSHAAIWSVLADKVIGYDPQYFEDFWTVPGYLGADPPPSLERARVRHEATVTRPVMAEEGQRLGLPMPLAMPRGVTLADLPVALRVEGLPDTDLRGAMLSITSGTAAGRNMWVFAVAGDLVVTGAGEDQHEGLSGVAAGDEILIDNSHYLAVQTYHRHQVHPDYPEWDQFCVAGRPIYPQRPSYMGPRFARGGAGSVQSGRFASKMIVVESLMDESAYPWQAVYYERLVERVLGPAVDDRFRLWFVDHAMHMAPTTGPDDPRPVSTTRIVNYAGVLQQALRDLAAWVEYGQAPPATTVHEVVDGQVVVPARARDRHGIQATVDVIAGGRTRTDVDAGEEVELSAVVEVPVGAGTIVLAEWDFDGSGTYPYAHPRSELDGSASRADLSVTHTFDRPGTYFPALRVTTQRLGDAETPYARVQNLGRVRVVVT